MSNSHAALQAAPSTPPLPEKQIKLSHIRALTCNILAGLTKDFECRLLPDYLVTTLGADWYRSEDAKQLFGHRLRQTKQQLQHILDVASNRSSEEARNVFTLITAFLKEYKSALELVREPEAIKLFLAQLDAEAVARSITFPTPTKTLNRGDIIRVTHAWKKDRWPFLTCKNPDTHVLVRVTDRDPQTKKVKGEIVVPVLWTDKIKVIENNLDIEWKQPIERSEEDDVIVVLDADKRQEGLKEAEKLFGATGSTRHSLGRGEKVTIVNMTEAPWFDGVTGVITSYIYDRARFSITIMQNVMCGKDWTVMVEPTCVKRVEPVVDYKKDNEKLLMEKNALMEEIRRLREQRNSTTLEEISSASLLRVVNEVLGKRNVPPIFDKDLRNHKYVKINDKE